MPGQQCVRHNMANQGTRGGGALPRPRLLPWGRVDTHADQHFLSCGTLPLSLFLHDCGTLVLRGTLCGVLSFFRCWPYANAGDCHAHAC